MQLILYRYCKSYNCSKECMQVPADADIFSPTITKLLFSLVNFKMGNGIAQIRPWPDLAEFTHMSTEFERMRTDGMSVEAIYNTLKSDEVRDPCSFPAIRKVEDAIKVSPVPSAVEGSSSSAGRGREGPTATTITATTTTNSSSRSSSSIAITHVQVNTHVSGDASGGNNDDKKKSHVRVAGDTQVLLIDDSPAALKITRRLLEQYGFTVLTASSAKQGYQMLLQSGKAISLVLLDIVLEDVDGIECLTWIKENPELAHVAVYMLTSLDDTVLCDISTDKGAEDLFLKPLSRGMIEDVISAQKLSLLSAATTESAPRDKYGDGGDDDDVHHIVEKKMDVPSMYDILSHPAGDLTHHDTIAIGFHAPPFRLCDHEYKEFTYPDDIDAGNTLCMFIPSLFMEDNMDPITSTGGIDINNMSMSMSTTNGTKTALQYIVKHYSQISENTEVRVMCVLICGDLPHTIRAARQILRLPPELVILSDPSLLVALRFVGAVDMGRLVAHRNNYLSVDIADDVGNRKLMPNLGLVLLDEEQTVLKRWCACRKEEEALGRNSASSAPAVMVPHYSFNFDEYPTDLIHWILQGPNDSSTAARKHKQAHAPRPSQISRSTGSAITSSSNSSNSNNNNHSRAPAGSTAQHLPTPRSVTFENEEIQGQEDALTAQASVAAVAVDLHVNNQSHRQAPVVLVVDDSSVSARVVSNKLKNEGFGTILAYNGELALKALEKEADKVSIILTDVVMPVMDGFELLKCVKSSEKLNLIPVVMLTDAFSAADEHAKAMSEKALAVMVKPFDVQKFIDIATGAGVTRTAGPT